MRPLEPDTDAVERLAAGADPALLAAAARVTAPSDQEVAALLGVLRRERVPTRRAWPVWVGGALLAGGMAFAALRAGEETVAVATVAPVAQVTTIEAAPAPVVVPVPLAAPETVVAPAPPRVEPRRPSERDAVADAPTAAPIPPPEAPVAAAPDVSQEPRAFAALLAREEAGEAPSALLVDVEAFAAGARSEHLRAEAELLALELRARAGRAPGELAERAHTWAGEHVEHPRVGTAWLIAGDAARDARDCAAAKEAWALAATSEEREVAARAKARKCR